jgi:hypothetical protein
MTRFAVASTIVVFMGAAAFIAGPAGAAPDKAEVQDATVKCKAQVKEQARFQEMSLWAKHKAVKKCVNDMVAGH